MIKKRFISSLLFVALFIFALALVANAAITASFVAPTGGEGVILTGNYTLNVSVSGLGPDNLTNYTWHYSTDSEATWVFLNMTNHTNAFNKTTANITLNTAVHFPQNPGNLTLNISIRTAQGNLTSVKLQNLRVDNAIPTTATCDLVTPSIAGVGSAIKINPTGSADASDTLPTINLTLWTVTSNQVVTNVIQVNDTTTPINIKGKYAGKFVLTCQVLDELQMSRFATNSTIQLTSSNGDDELPADLSGKSTTEIVNGKKAKAPIALFFILSVCVIGVVGYYVVSKKK